MHERPSESDTSAESAEPDEAIDATSDVDPAPADLPEGVPTGDELSGIADELDDIDAVLKGLAGKPETLDESITAATADGSIADKPASRLFRDVRSDAQS